MIPWRTKWDNGKLKKVPTINDYPVVADERASNDPDVVRGWFSEYDPDRGIGVMLGPESFYVIDYDPRNLNGTVPDLSAIPATRTHKTLQGGRHYLFQSDQTIKGQKIIGSALELLGPPGFVAIPPSAGYEVESPTSIAQWSPNIIADLKRMNRPQGGNGRVLTGGLGEITDASNSAVFERWIKNSYVYPDRAIDEAIDGALNSQDPGAAAGRASFENNPDRIKADVERIYEKYRKRQEAKQKESREVPKDETSKRRVDLAKYLDGSYTAPEPTIGARRMDNVPMLYKGRWHTVIGQDETYKSTLGLWHAAEILRSGGIVVYLHFEEIDPGGTTSKLLEMGVPPEIINRQFVWLDCSEPWKQGQLSQELSDLDSPELIILDGIIEFCNLHDLDPDKPISVGIHRRLLVTPGLATGAVVMSLGHTVKSPQRQSERHGSGAGQWLNVVDGVSFRVLPTNDMPGRGQLGYISVYAVKDRYGNLKKHGIHKPDVGVKWYDIGSMEIDNSDGTNLLVRMFPPTESEDTKIVLSTTNLKRAVLDAITEHSEVPSVSKLQAILRNRKVPHRKTALLDVLEDLQLSGDILEVRRSRNAKGYRIPP